jgi:crooked neck
MEKAVLDKRRRAYMEELEREPNNYDVWFDLTRLEEQATTSNHDKVRDLYERAVKQVPPSVG